MKLPAKELVEQLTEIASLIQKVLPALGIGILFCYCLAERIMPDDLSIGDALILVMVALGFGVVMVVGGVIGMMAAIAPTRFFLSLANLFEKKEKRTSLNSDLRDMTWASALILTLLSLFALLYASTGSARDMKFGQTVASFIITGFLLLVFFGVERKERTQRSLAMVILLCVASYALPIAVLHPALMNITMSDFGLRSTPGSLIVMSGQGYVKVENLVALSHIDVHFCPLHGSGSWATTDARVIWHGVGATSYLSLLDRSSGGFRSIVVPIAKQDLQVIRPEHWVFHCDKSLVGEATAH